MVLRTCLRNAAGDRDAADRGGHVRCGIRVCGSPMTPTPAPGVRSILRRGGEQAVLEADDLRAIDAYWRAANYCSVGQIYLLDNPLLREPLRVEHVKPRLMGHFGTTPGLNLVYAHLNRVIGARNLDMIYVIGPGHGGPGIVANSYLEGTYSEVYPHITQDEEGLRKLFRQFSFPGGIPSHVSPGTPGSIHEGGELGLLARARLWSWCSTIPTSSWPVSSATARRRRRRLAASWHSNKFLRSRRRRRSAPHPPSQRLQDRQSHRLGPDRRRRVAVAARGVRPPPDLRRG